jgi:transcription elongation factor SPT6
MNDYVEELMNHRKFVDMPEDELDDKLRKERSANPKGVFYNLCWMEMHAGYASLRYIMGSTPRFHLVGISPSGFVWGSRKYDTLDMLLNEFKKNPRGASTARRLPPTSTDSEPPRPAEPRASRWGSRPPPPSAPPPPAWGAAPAAPPPAPQWGTATASSNGQWNQPPPPTTTGYGRPPPPGYGRPPPPGAPPPYQRPPAPPGYP